MAALALPLLDFVCDAPQNGTFFAYGAGMPASRPPILLQISIEPRDARDWPRLVAALGANDDGTCDVDEQTGRVVLGGTSEDEVDAKVAALQERAGLPLKVGAPQIAYRETITRHIEMDTTHKKPVADGGFEFARVKLALAPADAWSFEAATALPAPFLAGIEAGLTAGRRAGVLGGYPVVDTAVKLVDGAWHDRDSSPRAFEMATLTAFRHAQKEVGVLLEPIMRVELAADAAFAGIVRDDLYLRRGEIESRVNDGGQVRFVAQVPFANVLGYESKLRQLSHGTGCFEQSFSHFAQIEPPEPPDFPGSMALRA